MNAMHRRGFLRFAVGTIIVVPLAGRFLVACSSDDNSDNPGDVDPPAGPPDVQGIAVVFSSSLTTGHFHTFSIGESDLSAPSGAVAGTTSTAEGHNHSVNVTMAQLASVAAGQTIKVTTGSQGVGHSHVLTLLKISGTSEPDSGAGGGGGGGGGSPDAGGDGGGAGGGGIYGGY
jgi:hypothetical protein